MRSGSKSAERLGEGSGDVLGFHRLRSLLWMDECGSSRQIVSGDQKVVSWKEMPLPFW